MYRNYINHYKTTTFTKTFGLDLTEFKEGYFTHLFNTRANMEANYNNELPTMKYYMTARMAKQMKQPFEKWYAQQFGKCYAGEKAKGVKFNLTEEREGYCIDDVKLLLEGCLTFQRDVHKQARLNPFTIASPCNQDKQSRHAGRRTSLRLAFEC